MNSTFERSFTKLATKQLKIYRDDYLKNFMQEYRVTYWKQMRGVEMRTLVTIRTSALNKIQAFDNIRLLEQDCGMGYTAKLISVEPIS